jgi:hypothetical protein
MDDAFIRHSTARHKVVGIARGEDATGMDEEPDALAEATASGISLTALEALPHGIVLAS